MKLLSKFFIFNLNNAKCHRLLSSLSSVRPNDPIIDSKLIKKATVRTCVGIYDELKKTNPIYKNSPSEGVDLTFNYVDSCPESNGNKKVIVAIHGSIDTFQTFSRQIEHFAKNPNVRIIVPNLPDFSHSRQTNFSFMHSTEEKYHFIKDFLKKINVKQVDCLLGHSLGIQPCAALWQRQESIPIKSVGIIAPQFLLEPFEKKINRLGKLLMMLKPQFITSFLDGIKFYEKFKQFKFRNMDDIYWVSCMAFDLDAHSASVSRVKALIEQKIPGFIMFGSNDKIITKFSREEPFRLLNIEEKDKIFLENDDPKFLDDVLSKSKPRILPFICKDAAHFPHIRFSKCTNRLIELQFL